MHVGAANEIFYFTMDKNDFSLNCNFMDLKQAMSADASKMVLLTNKFFQIPVTDKFKFEKDTPCKLVLS